MRIAREERGRGKLPEIEIVETGEAFARLALSYRSGQPALTSGNGVTFPVAKWPQTAES